jgi:serine/threonine protein kinase
MVTSSSNVPPLPRTGTLVARYELGELVGAGGMSRVWSARDSSTGELVALKLLHGGEDMAPSVRERLLREARASRSIEHPSIVPVREVFEYEGDPVLVMELLAGETLRQRLERERRVPLAEAARLLLPVAEALRAAHRAGIAHRDLKPENVFLQLASGGAPGAPSRVRLLDFGVARFYDPPPQSGLFPITGFDALLGTLCYMAPEQATRPGDSDQRVDVWAFGVVLYEMLAGCRPIEGETLPEVYRQLLTGGIVPLEVLDPTLPDDIVEVTRRFLVRNRDTRAPDLELGVQTLGRYV